MKTQKPQNKRKRKFLLIPLLLLLVLVCAMGIYLGSFYHASEDAMAVAAAAPLTAELNGQQVLIYGPEEAFCQDVTDTALILYPGGKVWYEAYAPLCSKLAERGILCALVEMPFNLAVFDMDAADDVMTLLSENFGCTDFYLGGHSLGGAMACAYAADAAGKLQGLVLLGAYSASDLSATALRVLSIYGSEDGVLSREKYEENLKNLPEDFTELVIQGGCHSYFGDYGHQKGDGEPTLTRAEQLDQTADAIADWLETA